MNSLDLDWDDLLERLRLQDLREQLNEIREAYVCSHLDIPNSPRYGKFGIMSYAKANEELERIGLPERIRQGILRVLDKTAKDHIANGVKPRSPFTYCVICPGCGHQMTVGSERGSLRSKHCDKCNEDFSFTRDKLVANK